MREEGWSKLKILYILDILNRETDEENIISVTYLIKKLSRLEIRTERKSVIRDIKLLVQFGYDISVYEENGKGYYMRTRDFEPHEIQLLVDAVQASKFLTRDKTRELINKFKNLTSKNYFNSIRNCALINNNIKSRNEQIYYNVDKIKAAINDNKQIEFQYYSLDIEKKLSLYNEGYKFKVSPYYLSWFQDNYYMRGNPDNTESVTDFRIDKMINIELINEFRTSINSLNDSEITSVEEKALYDLRQRNIKFENIELKCNKNMVAIAVEKFGYDITLINTDVNRFTLKTRAIVDDDLLAWIFKYSDSIEIISPLNLRKKLRKKSEYILNNVVEISNLNDVMTNYRMMKGSK